MPEVVEAGQHRLMTSKVMLVGAGGLGSPAAFYLAATGIWISYAMLGAALAVRVTIVVPATPAASAWIGPSPTAPSSS